MSASHRRRGRNGEGTDRGRPSEALRARKRTCIRSVRPAGQRLLTGAFDERTSFVSSDFRNLLATFARRKEATPAQIALARLLAQKPWIVPIPGTTKPARLEENIAAADVTLTPGELRELDAAASQIQVHGARYPAHLEAMTGR